MTDDERPYLGRGWAFPVRIGYGGDIATAAAEDDVHQAIRIILETAPGERVMRPDFGVGLRRLLFLPVTRSMLATVRYRIEQALLVWEPRIRVHDVDMRPDPQQPGVVQIDIQYRVRATNAVGNLVYPFYLNEGQQG